MTVEHVAVRYGQLDVLRDVNVITRRGDRIVIVGKNGAGKSSLLRCLAGTQDAQEGNGQVRRQRHGRLLRPGERAVGLHENGPGQPRQLHGRIGRAAALDARRIRAEGLGRPPDAGHALGWRASEARSGHPGVLERQSLVAGRTDQQPGPGQRRGPRRDDAPVERAPSSPSATNGDSSRPWSPRTRCCCPRSTSTSGTRSTWTSSSSASSVEMALRGPVRELVSVGELQFTQY
jgi:energy-coupling factor transporter ATP-binding protein EcfA2